MSQPTALLVPLCLTLGLAAPAPVSLRDQFKTPPSQYKPWTFWYWMNNHVTREGITRDLEAMKRFGIGTAIIGNIYIDGLPDGPVPLLGETWLDHMVFAVREARRVGIDLGLFNCPGWSEAGGPWIEPKQAMRYLNWSETRVTGGRTFDGILPQPKEQFQDVVVLAIPVPAEDSQSLRILRPRVEAAGAIDPPDSLFDGNLSTVVRFPPGAADWTIRFETDEPFTARSLVLNPSESIFRFHAELRAVRDDGTVISIRRFEFVCGNNRLNVGPVPYAPLTVGFPAVTSRRWELILSGIDVSDPNAEYFPPKPPGERREGLAGLDLLAAPRIERVLEKQLAKLHPTPKPVWDTYHFPEQAESGTELAIETARIIDLSDRMTLEGRLRWEAPRGDWVIQRIGMSATGVKNHPGAPNAVGLEADKMSRKVMVHHFDSFVGRVIARLSTDERQALKYLGADSYEVGSQNWTDGNDLKFIQGFGYDPKPWLAVLSGRVVGSVDQSDRFLWDFRRHIADRIAVDYVGGLTAVAQAAGLKSWVQNYGHWGFPAEFLQYGGQADLLSGEFWVGKDLGGIECRAAASAAHIYGKPVVWAEGFTSADFFERHPFALKARGDWAFTEGINHLLLQCSMLQFDERKPGVNAWFGTEMNRHNTWYAQGRAWTEYLQRCHLLLQSGLNVANVAVFIGEDVPAMTGPTRPSVPSGYAFDFINAEVIRDRLAVRDGRFVLPDGTSYDLLVLPAAKTIRPEVLERIRELVRAGGAILGTPPERSPSLVDYPLADGRVKQMASELWSGAGRFGAGRVFTGDDIAGTLLDLSIAPDVTGVDSRTILWVHRSTPNAEVYFVSNQTDEPVILSPVFRVSGRMPELWDAVTGTIAATARYATTRSGTRVDLSLGRRGSVFVVFPRASSTAVAPVVAIHHEGRSDADLEVVRADEGLRVRVERNGAYRLEREQASPLDFEVSDLPEPHTLGGRWVLSFPPGMDTPAAVTLTALTPWNEHDNVAIRHFSGTANYATEFTVPPGWLGRGRRVWLELGRVEVIADIIVNGRDLGTAWLPPYRIEITDNVRVGVNLLEIRVSNLWRNRIIGDLKYPDGYPDGPRPKQFRTELFTLGWWKRDDVLQPSGLLGPSRLLVTQNVLLETR